MADEKDREEIIVAEFHKKIKEAFEVFDHESNNTVDVREIGTIIRSLGCCPTEGELHDLIAEVEEEEPTGYIRFEKFLPVMTEILLERRYRPIPEDVLLRAFEVLDSAKRGFLTKDELIKYMTEEVILSGGRRLPNADEFQGLRSVRFQSPHVEGMSTSNYQKDMVTAVCSSEAGHKRAQLNPGCGLFPLTCSSPVLAHTEH
ncbi:PREDICTED: EF-hand calcium-binding domain-containing protein 2 isoform X2 [Rhinopithecus bieti]|uniref:EF-hand calcium-binding domain-containing protein 2 isoform X2 n=1 Tax=Rhinopithecus bieti TaxID=61621 RepID=UPI00083C238C|nr:PREDICTED: EF-hand calcium-binding domain-containing protein 2 isoform X2 [Rhinopithecus bieti]XP_017725902.1 PREDICTED: EF-hand calcium-binding domain-containing protein 2 isoform X2 [Rhinopithecus bieti]